MALAAFGRVMAREGVHPSDIAVVPSAFAAPADNSDATRAQMRRDAESIALTRRVKAQEKALREAGREVDALRRRIAGLEQEVVARDIAIADQGLQIAALESDVMARDRRIATLSNGGER